MRGISSSNPPTAPSAMGGQPTAAAAQNAQQQASQMYEEEQYLAMMMQYQQQQYQQQVMAAMYQQQQAAALGPSMYMPQQHGMTMPGGVAQGEVVEDPNGLIYQDENMPNLMGNHLPPSAYQFGSYAAAPHAAPHPYEMYNQPPGYLYGSAPTSAYSGGGGATYSDWNSYMAQNFGLGQQTVIAHPSVVDDSKDASGKKKRTRNCC
eukprot:Trichotokara_eunicae@DN6015_c0_g1_i1.p1